MGDPHIVNKRDPEDIFKLLADETRIEIISALWDIEDSSATFSDLREAVGMRDSGQFNYHLNQLTDIFITKDEEGYSLTQVGMRTVGAIEAGSYTIESMIEPMEVGIPCGLCGNDRTFRYEDDTVDISCDRCNMGTTFPVPPRVILDRDIEEVPTITGRYLNTMIEHLKAGFCGICDGHVEREVNRAAEIIDLNEIDESPDTVEAMRDVPIVLYTCTHCGIPAMLGLSAIFLHHPHVQLFHRRAGFEEIGSIIWRYASFRPDAETFIEEDDAIAAVKYEFDGETLTLSIDDNLEVVEVDASGVKSFDVDTPSNQT